MIRGLVLDYGEVLCHKPAAGRMERMARSVGIDAGVFAARYHAERGPYDRGDLSPVEYWGRVAAGLSDAQVETLRQWDVEMWSDVDLNLVGWLDRARDAGMKTALLSNMHSDMARHVRREFEWLRRMDALVLSCEVRMIKPSRAIYLRSVDGLGLKPEETCFVDDREVNVEGARRAGMAAVLYRGAAPLRAELAELWVPVLPPLH